MRKARSTTGQVGNILRSLVRFSTIIRFCLKRLVGVTSVLCGLPRMLLIRKFKLWRFRSQLSISKKLLSMKLIFWIHSKHINQILNSLQPEINMIQMLQRKKSTMLSLLTILNTRVPTVFMYLCFLKYKVSICLKLSRSNITTVFQCPFCAF